MIKFNHFKETQLYYENRKKHYAPRKLLYVLEWTTEQDKIYGYGVSETGDPGILQVENCNTSLYVFTKKEQYFNAIFNLKYISLHRQILKLENTKFEIPPDTLLHALVESNSDDHETDALREFNVYEIPTKSHSDSMSLHKLLNSTALKNYIHTTAIWSLELNLIFEQTKRGVPLENCKVYNVYFDTKLKHVADTNPPHIPMRAFDIETVSSINNRIPIGDAKNDVLFSIAIVDYDSKTILSAINLPHCLNSSDDDDERLAKKRKMDTAKLFDVVNSKYKELVEFKRKMKIVTDERSLLKWLLSEFDAVRNVHVMLGYNSKGYDIPFLLKRAAYLNLPEFKNFWSVHGMPVYGFYMIHIDMLKIFQKLYPEVTSHNLDNMARLCLEGVRKVKFDAVNLRHIYRHILDHGIPDGGNFEKYNVDLNTIMSYNEMDSVLLIRLWNVLNYDSFLPCLYRSHLISIIRYCQCKIGEFINNKSVYDALCEGKVLTLHKSIANDSVISVCSDKFLYRYNHNRLAAGINETSFGGGFNMRVARQFYTNCQVNDVVAYYPKLQEGLNISYESVALIEMRSLKFIKPYLNFEKHECRFFVFTVHKNSKDEMVNQKNTRDLIKSLIGNCDELSSLQECESRLTDSDRIFILSKSKKKTLLGGLITRQNYLRDLAKENKKKLEELLQHISMRINTFHLNNEDEINFFDDDDDDDSDDGNKDETKVVQIQKSDKKKCIDMDMLEPSVRLMSFDEIGRCKSINELIQHQSDIKGELSRINSLYRNLKIVNCSYYGLLGSDYGALSGRTVAAITTTLGRKYIIDMAKAAERNDSTAILIDTDSVFVCNNSSKNNNTNHVNNYIKTLNVNIEISTKIYQYIFVMAKKVYIAKCKGKYLSRGINKNGPAIWDDIIFSLTEKYLVQRTPITCDDLVSVLENEIYNFILNRVKEDKSIVVCTMSPKSIDANTPIANMMRRVREEESTFIFSRKVNYFHYKSGSPTNVSFESAHRLENTPLSKLNLFKFISKINNPIYQILSKAIGDCNYRLHKTRCTITKSEFDSDSLIAFVNVNEKLSI